MSSCLACNKKLEGRSDKKYCDSHCKSAYYYNKRKYDETDIFATIDKQLKLNRRLLKKFNQSGKVIIRPNILVDAGFNPNYFTHFWKNRKGQVYFFVYEFGFIKIKEREKEKFVLVKWQEYMKKDI